MSQESTQILLVDDDRAHRFMMRGLLSDLGHGILCAENGEQALEILVTETVDLMLLDMRMPVMDGLGTLRAMQARSIHVPTIVLTAHAEIQDAVEAMKLGARDYLRKPIDMTQLQELLATVLGESSTPAPNPLADIPEGMVFAAPLMLQVLSEVRRVAPTDASVLLRGETGTGKDIVATLLHQWSRRVDGPMIPVNMAALPESLMESELFGHIKGAFTGADQQRSGRFQAAHGGTLFLDEVGEIPLELQPKLLRVLQTRQVSRLGDSHEEKIDYRLVSASNRDLEAEIEAGRFRQDLYFRLAVITIEIPPLRERREDILPLARRFLAQGSEGRKRLSPSTEDRLLAYDWPGNIRELENSILRASILAPGDVVLPENLPPQLRSSHRESGPGANTTARSLLLADLEKKAIFEALEKCDGNRSEASRLLGISRRKLLYRLKEYREGSRKA